MKSFELDARHGLGAHGAAFCARATSVGRRRLLLALLASLTAFAAIPSSASAGFWIQVSCVNPNGTAAPSQGWSTGETGNDPGGIVSDNCTPGTPMTAQLSILAGAPPNSSEYLEYQPPSGSAIAGGEVNGTLEADGYGSNASASAASYAGLYSPDTNSPFLRCVAFFTTCDNSNNFSGVAELPSYTGGQLYAIAGCSSSAGTDCDANPKDNAWALANIAWAQILLQSSESPTGTQFSGSALAKRLRGTAQLVFTAAEPGGPGIYSVLVAIDGRVAWAGTPNTNGGLCVPVGNDGTTLMFDFQQPCLTSEGVDVPVPTGGFQDGSHELAVAVVDAAGSASTVLDQTIHTFNPQVTPNPHGPHAIHARFVISWHWHGSITRLESITVSHLPHGSGVAVSCHGRRCPALPIAHENAPAVRALLKSLTGQRFHAGDRLDLVVSKRHHRPERIQLRFRRGRDPSARLLRG